MGGVRRARNLDIPRLRIELAEPAALLLALRFFILARHEQDRASDTGQDIVGQLGTRHAVLVQGRHQVAPVLWTMVGLMKASQREWPPAVESLQTGNTVVTGASRARGDEDERSGSSGSIQLQRQRNLRAVGETHDMRAAHV